MAHPGGTGLLLLMVLTFLIHSLQGIEEELSEYVVSECYGDIFNFDCGRGNKIRINKDFFGFSKERTCRYSKGECIISNPKSNSLIHRFCTGHRVCTYYLVERRGCGGSFSNYQQVEYQCIPDAMVTDICSIVDYKASSTYISSPNFPENYPPKLNCRCVVSTVSPKAKVRMEIVYLAIKYTNPCRDWLSIGLRRTCGTTMDLFQGRRIPIEFRSDSDDSHSGFWLHFKSSIPGDQVHVQCGNVTLRAPRRRPHLKRRPVAGTEGGGSDDDVIERSPRPEDIPEERTTTPKGDRVIATPTTIVRPTAYTTVTRRNTQDKQAPTTNAATSHSYRTTTVSTIGVLLEESQSPSDSKDLNRPETGSDSKSSPELSSNSPGLGSSKVEGKHSDDNVPSPDQAIPNSSFGSFKTEVTTSPTGISTPGIANTDNAPGSGRQNNSRLDDEEAWISPAIVDVTPKDTVDDEHFRFDRNGNRSLSGNLTLNADGAAGEGNAESDAGPRSTKRPLVPTVAPSVGTAPKKDSFFTIGIVIISVCVALGILLVCIVLLVVCLRRHRTRDEETQTPRQKTGSDGDSGQGLLVSRTSHRGCRTADKSLQIDMDSDVDVVAHFVVGGHGDSDVDAFSLTSSHLDPNCKGVQVTSHTLAKARFRDLRSRKRSKTLIGKSSSSGIDVKGCETTEGSSSECGSASYFRPVSDLSDPGSSYTDQDFDHRRSLASMSQYSEVTLMPENAVLPSDNDYYDSFSDPDWDQKSAISI